MSMDLSYCIPITLHHPYPVDVWYQSQRFPSQAKKHSNSRCALGTIQPLYVPQSSPDLSLLELCPRKLLLLLLCLEFHVRIVLGARIRRRRCGAADGATDVTAAGARVLEAVERDGEVAFVRHTAVGDVPLLWT